MPSDRTVIQTDQAPEAIGPYSQAIKAGNLVFVSGQIPINAQNGQLVEGDIQQQTNQVLINVKAVLNAAGSSLENVVKTTVYIRNMDDFPLINETYQTFFTRSPPARACVEVSNLPRNVDVEIDAIAVI
ncbi:RidA family protein [bacterium]|nr:RidA family protein [bacterium]